MNINYDKKQRATLIVVIVTAFITTFTGSALTVTHRLRTAMIGLDKGITILEKNLKSVPA